MEEDDDRIVDRFYRRCLDSSYLLTSLTLSRTSSSSSSSCRSLFDDQQLVGSSHRPQRFTHSASMGCQMEMGAYLAEEAGYYHRNSLVGEQRKRIEEALQMEEDELRERYEGLLTLSEAYDHTP